MHEDSEDEKSQAERTRHVGALPHVVRWIRRFQRVARDMPPEVWVYVASGTPCVMARDAHGRRMATVHGGTSQHALLATIERKNASWDGGDW